MFHCAGFYTREKDRECMRLYNISFSKINENNKARPQKIIRNEKKNERKILSVC